MSRLCINTMDNSVRNKQFLFAFINVLLLGPGVKHTGVLRT